MLKHLINLTFVNRWLRPALFVCLIMAAPRPGRAFDEIGGVISFEAEQFATNLSPRGLHSWTVSNDAVPGFSGSGYMEAVPNLGTNLSADWLNTSPELRYPVNFTNAGTHYVWIRAYASTNTDDSVHAGLDGTTNTASAITLVNGQYGLWVLTTNRTGLRPAVSGGVGAHTFHLWMREDGMRVDRVFLMTDPSVVPDIGNAWHIPTNPEAAVGLPSMRIPLSQIFPNTAVTIVNGNQYQGAGNAANQASSTSAIYYKRSTDTNWSTLPMAFLGQGGNNKYFSNAIPAGVFSSGDVVQYYLRIGYTDRLTTFLYGNDNNSFSSELESVAQATPFLFTVQAGLLPLPGSAYLSVTNLTPQGPVEARIYQASGHLALVGPDLVGNPLTNAIIFAPPQARVGGGSYQIGAVLSATVISNGLELVQRLSTASVVSRLTFKADGVMRYEVVNWGSLPVDEVFLQSGSDTNEHFFGLGEKFNAFDQTGNLVHLLNVDVAGSKGDNSYVNTPWFISTRGYGLHLDSSAESWFDLRKANADRFIVTNRFPSLKFNVVYGPQLTNVLARFTGYVGRPPAPPAWAFAPWMSSDIWHTGGEVRYLINKYRKVGIPGSVLVFDSPWEVGYNDFNWNMTQFGNSGVYEGVTNAGFASVTDMMTFLRTNGFKVITWLTPFINTSSVNDGVGGQNTGQSANYATGAASNRFVRASAGGPPLVVNWWKGTGSPVDFTNPEARQWLTAQLSNLVVQSGDVIGGFKPDDGESGSADGNTYIPTNAVYFDGRTGVEMRNGYASEYHKTLWNVLGTNGIIFARSGFTGSQAYSGVWAGDNEPNFGEANGLASVVVAGQSAAMSGYAIWSHDIGGYQDSNFSTTPENLFMRWAQFGALSPLMQMHRQVGSNRQYPWSFGDPALSNYVFYARLHTALFPYLYTYAAQVASSGLPILRPFVLLNQADANTYGLRHTYLLGNELLYAAIITNNATARTVYLPAGNWRDFFSQAGYTGGQNINWTNVNQAQCPLFVREGAIVPMTPTNVDTLCDASYVGNSNVLSWNGALDFLVYPAADSSFALYDGTSLQCQSNGTVTTLSLSSPPRPVKFRVFAPQPFGVEQGGVSLTRFTNDTAFAQAYTGWHYAAPFVEVKLSHSGGATQIAFGADSVGDGISDSWRKKFFGSGGTTNSTSCAACDSDNDGASNLHEYFAGTDPTDGNSVLRITHLDANTRLISWNSVPGRSYQVFAGTNLSTPYTPLGGAVQAAGAISTLTDTNAAADRQFYRIQLLP